jgi:hypothetical protein
MDKSRKNKVIIICKNKDRIISKENKFPFGLLDVKILFGLILMKKNNEI